LAGGGGALPLSMTFSKSTFVRSAWLKDQ